jgi:hypothetical protein
MRYQRPSAAAELGASANVGLLQIKPHTFHMAKAAHVADYDINANWKLVYENNRCVSVPALLLRFPFALQFTVWL